MAAADNPLDHLTAALPPAAGYVVAFSGGLDSSVLLHRLAGGATARPLRAVHIRHDLQPAAADWAAHCRDRCVAWEVPLTVHRVRVEDSGREGPEAAARRARYAALEAELGAGEVLLTAHHAEDQAETFLLQALRGSGVAGLAGMPGVAAFGAGRHARPMLTIPRAAIRAYAQAHGLAWVEDPSNADPAVARAYVRHRLWPAITGHWPEAAPALARAAAWNAEAAELQREWGELDVAACAGERADCLSVTALAALGPARRRNTLRHWLRELALPTPDRSHVEAIERDCLSAREDATPCVRWPGAEVRRYRDRLYAMPPLTAPPAGWSVPWDPATPAPVPGGGRLSARWAMGGLAPGLAYALRLRHGGERLRLPGRAHHTKLRIALQDAGVPPWLRDRLPLVVAGEQIAAVADLWVCADFAVADTDGGWQPVWCDAPPGWPPAAPLAGSSC